MCALRICRRHGGVDAITCTTFIFGHSLSYSRNFKVSERPLLRFKAPRDDGPSRSALRECLSSLHNLNSILFAGFVKKQIGGAAGTATDEIATATVLPRDDILGMGLLPLVPRDSSILFEFLSGCVASLLAMTRKGGLLLAMTRKSGVIAITGLGQCLSTSSGIAHTLFRNLFKERRRLAHCETAPIRRALSGRS